MTTRGKDTYTIQSVENALALLEVLSDEGDEVSLSRLSERLGMKKASLFRLLATFENNGYVEQEAGSRKYRLGPSAFEIGQKFLSRMSLLRQARSVMDQLAREFNEATYLVVRRQNEALFLDMVDSTQQVKIVSLLGKRFPLQETAAGKIFLAYDPTTQKTAPLITPILPDLIKARTTGSCIDHHGVGQGTTTVAVPLLNSTSEVPGVLTLVGPDFRFPPERIESTLLPALRGAAEVVSSRLGYLGHVYGEQYLV